MRKLALSSSHLECEVGGVYHLCYFNITQIEDILNKNEENAPLSGQIFPYVAHYLITGDLVYPAHEGENQVSLLLQEMRRLDLLQRLFPTKIAVSSNAPTVHGASGKVSPSFSEGEEMSSPQRPLRIRTKDTRWASRSLSRLFGFSKSANEKQPSVYRPPNQQNKGSTVVVIRSVLQGRARVRIHGPPTTLRTLLPDVTLVIGQHTHHHLSAQVEPSSPPAHTLVQTLEDEGFIVTVRSSRVESESGAVVTQWILYRRTGKRFSPTGGSASRSMTFGKSLGGSKNSHFLSTSRKKVPKVTSSSHLRSPISNPPPPDTSKTAINETEKKFNKQGETLGKTVPEKDKTQTHDAVNVQSRNSQSGHFLESPSSQSSENALKTEPALNPSHSKTSFCSSPSRSSPSFDSSTLKASSPQKTAFPPTKLSLKVTTTSRKLAKVKESSSHSGEEEPPSVLRSYSSSSSISNQPTTTRKLKRFPSLWEVCSNCSKFSVKKVLAFIF